MPTAKCCMYVQLPGCSFCIADSSSSACVAHRHQCSVDFPQKWAQLASGQVTIALLFCPISLQKFLLSKCPLSCLYCCNLRKSTVFQSMTRTISEHYGTKESHMFVMSSRRSKSPHREALFHYHIARCIFSTVAEPYPLFT